MNSYGVWNPDQTISSLKRHGREKKHWERNLERIARHIHRVQRRRFQDELDVLGSDGKIFRYMNVKNFMGIKYSALNDSEPGERIPKCLDID